jgi:hypothetical protein
MLLHQRHAFGTMRAVGFAHHRVHALKALTHLLRFRHILWSIPPAGWANAADAPTANNTIAGTIKRAFMAILLIRA